MTMDSRIALYAAQKIRSIRKGSLVILISMAVVVCNAAMAVIVALRNPIGFVLHGAMEGTAALILIGAMAVLVGVIIYLVGLYGLRDIRPEYHWAFWWEIGMYLFGIVINIIGKETGFGKGLEGMRTILGLGVTWLVIQGTMHLLENLGREDILRWGQFVWRLSAVFTVLGAVYQFVPAGSKMSPWMITVLVTGVILSILSMVVAICYVNYLGQAARALEQAAGTMEEAPPL